MPHGIPHVLAQDTARLAKALSLDAHTAHIEAQCLLQHVLNVSRAFLLAHPEYQLDENERSRYRMALHRRLLGEPVAYILGEREFFGLNFKVTPDVLIPRPETELLVELALRRIPPDSPHHILDLGTGSGAIALSIAHARPEIQGWASDASPNALAIARENAQRLKITNITFMQGNWYTPFALQCFDLIISNPPYVAIDDMHLHQGDLRFEPISALGSGPDGLADISCIVAGAPAHLSSGGWLLLEHGYDQAMQVRGLLHLAGFGEIFSAPDLAGIERVSGGRIA